MANSYTVLANLRAGRCSNTAEVRLLRFWDAKNINKGGALMSVEMLLIDEHVSIFLKICVNFEFLIFFLFLRFPLFSFKLIQVWE